MSSGIFFQVISIIYMILLLIVYYAKQRLDTIENKIFRILMITNFIGLIIDIFSVYTIKVMSQFPILNLIVTKMFLRYIFLLYQEKMV